MNPKTVILLLVMAVGVALNSDYVNGQSAIVRWSANTTIAQPMNDLLKTFQSRGGLEAGIDAKSDDKASIGRFADKDEPFSVIFIAGTPTVEDNKLLARRFTKSSVKPEIRCIGQRRIAVIVNDASPVRSLSMAAIGKMLSDEGKKTTWASFGGGSSLPRCYTESKRAWSMELIRRKCMAYEEQANGYVRKGWLPFRDDLDENADAAEVIKKVKADHNGIGFIQYTGQSMKGVKLVAIAETDKGPFSAMGEGLILQDDYDLAEPLMVYIHPNAPPSARQFCDYTCSADGSAILEKHGFITPYRQQRAEGMARLDDVKHGRGVTLQVMAYGRLEGGVKDFVNEYVMAKAPIQAIVGRFDSDVAAIGLFVQLNIEQPTSAPTKIVKKSSRLTTTSASSAPASKPTTIPVVSAFVAAGGKELLLLDDRMSDAAMRASGEKWNTLGRDENGKPNGSGPTEYVPAGRAVAVIVNAANKAESLTLDQIKSIFSGEAGSWKMVGGAGVASGSGKINCFGMGVNDPSTVLFGKEALAVSKFKGVTIKKDAAEVIAAVSMDTDAIGFVDLTAIPTTGQSVKILAIQLGTGEKARIIQPTAQNIKNSMYPLSSRIFLYVHPNASDTAKDFAKFIATCGGSESSPYADTVKSMMETYRKNGLIPLSDAAITRAAKDAMAAAKVKEADAPAKPK